MRKDYEELFTHLPHEKPPPGLFRAIMARIREEERLLSVRRRLILFAAVILSSSAAFVPVVRAFREEFARSGFSLFVSLLFSDFGFVAAHWQDFGLTLLESLPATSAIMLLTTTLVFLWSSTHLAAAWKSLNYSQRLVRN